MQLFPERDVRSRRFLIGALALSLAVHLIGGVLWPLVVRRLANQPPPERVAAQVEPITIERRPPPTPTATPEPTPTPSPTPQPAAARSHVTHQPPAASAHRLARLLAATPMPVPTLPPLPPKTLAHSATVIHQQAERNARTPAAGARKDLFAPHQLDADEGAFRRTIAQTHANGADQNANGSAGPRGGLQEILGGTIGEDVRFGGTCNDYAPSLTREGFVYHYLTCRVAYSDGFTELVSYPWPFRFPAASDPFLRSHATFDEATPPPGFVLPPDFAPSRRVCTFYHSACVAKLAPARAATQQ